MPQITLTDSQIRALRVVLTLILDRYPDEFPELDGNEKRALAGAQQALRR